MELRIGPPQHDEYSDFHRGYVAAVESERDGLALLERQMWTIENMHQLTPAQSSRRYADGKWSIKEVIGHLSDTERVLSYRLLCIARGDQTPLPGFDENAYVVVAQADGRELGSLVQELVAVRAATLALVRSLDEAALARRGIVKDSAFTPRGLVFIIAGHFAHHMNVLRDRYGVTV